MQGLGVGPRYSTRDHWTQESIKGIFNSGLFWAVEAAERIKPNFHKYFLGQFFLCFQGQIIILFYF